MYIKKLKYANGEKTIFYVITLPSKAISTDLVNHILLRIKQLELLIKLVELTEFLNLLLVIWLK